MNRATYTTFKMYRLGRRWDITLCLLWANFHQIEKGGIFFTKNKRQNHLHYSEIIYSLGTYGQHLTVQASLLGPLIICYWKKVFWRVGICYNSWGIWSFMGSGRAVYCLYFTPSPLSICPLSVVEVVRLLIQLHAMKKGPNVCGNHIHTVQHI